MGQSLVSSDSYLGSPVKVPLASSLLAGLRGSLYTQRGIVTREGAGSEGALVCCLGGSCLTSHSMCPGPKPQLWSEVKTVSSSPQSHQDCVAIPRRGLRVGSACIFFLRNQLRRGGVFKRQTLGLTWTNIHQGK